MTVLYNAGSIACAASNSLLTFVGARLVQGAGGAMMTPVGRAILVGATPREQLVSAMVWFTTPALVGPLLGPPIAGFILSVADWRWIFYINLPIGIAGMAAVVASCRSSSASGQAASTRWASCSRASASRPCDLLAETAGAGLMSVWMQAVVALLAFATLTLYVRHSLRLERPILNLRLLSLASYRSSLLGGTLVRLGLGATPFLMPLLLQVGLGWDPAKAGLVTDSDRGRRDLHEGRRRYRRSSASAIARCWSITASSALSFLGRAPRSSPACRSWLMIAILLAGGFFRSLQFTAINTIAYAEIEPQLMSRATAITSVAQQLALSTGVAVGALIVEITLLLRQGTAMSAADFPPAFLFVAASTAAASLVFLRLPSDAGAELAGRGAADTAEAQKK